jgi:hypothetical protein
LLPPEAVRRRIQKPLLSSRLSMSFTFALAIDQ